MVIFTEPSMEHLDALRKFKEAFGDHAMHGTCGLRRCKDIAAWIRGEERTDPNSDCYILYDDEHDDVVAIARFTPIITDMLVKVHGYNFGYSVHPDYRRQGYGARILREVARVATQRGMRGLLMAAKTTNKASWLCMESVGAERLRHEDWDYIYCLSLPIKEK